MVRRDAMNIEAAFAAWMFIAVRYELLRMTGSGKSIRLDRPSTPGPVAAGENTGVRRSSLVFTFHWVCPLFNGTA